MWSPKILEIENLFSYKDCYLEFTNGISTLIQGKNEFDPEMGGNGTGKSSLQEVVGLALLGSPTRPKIRTVDVVRLGEKSGRCRLVLENPRLQQTLEIHRGFPIKGSTTLMLRLNNREVEFSSVLEGEKKIFDILGISKEDLLNFYLLSRERYKSFFHSSDTDKKAILGRFSNTSLLDKTEELLRGDIEVSSAILEQKRTEATRVEGQIEALDRLIQEQESAPNLEVRKQQGRTKIELQITGEKDSIKEIESQIDTYLLEIEKEKKNLIELKEKKVTAEKSRDEWTQSHSTDEWQREIEEKNNLIAANESSRLQMIQRRDTVSTEISELTKEKDENQNLESTLNTIASGAVVCPHCEKSFLLDSEITLEEVKENLPLVRDEVKRLIEEIERKSAIRDGIIKEIQGLMNANAPLRDVIVDIEKKISGHAAERRAYDNAVVQVESVITTVTSRIESQEIQIKGKRKNIESHEEVIGNLEKDLKAVDNWTDADTIANMERLQQNKKENEEVLERLKDAIQSTTLKLESQDQWILIFKRFRNYLANKSVKVIEYSANHFLREMKSNLQLQIDGIKTLADGSTRENITPTVLRNGIAEGSFFKFSGGERARVELAIITTLQTLCNQVSPTGGLDLLMVDEILEACSKENLNGVIKSLGMLHKTVYVTSHVEAFNAECPVLMVTKGRDKISRIG